MLLRENGHGMASDAQALAHPGARVYVWGTMARLRPDQWADIRAAWIGTDKPIRELAREFGVDHKSITERAGKELWGDRNSSLRKAEKVAARLAGSPKPPNEPPNGEDTEADRDVEVMTIAGDVGRSILERCRDLLQGSLDPKDLNQTTDAWRKAIDGYRRVRGLDLPAPPGDAAPRAYADLTDEDLDRKIREAEAQGG